VSTVELPTRLPRWLLVRRGKSLPVERMRLRLAAYVYGGILVLGAIAVANGETIADGHAALVVAATTATTYLAHVLAHRVGEQIGRPRGTERDHWRQEARDSTPILFAGVTPTIVLLLPTVTSLPTEAA
jgi:O-antigen/teichoic acid export membrane protein